MAAFRLVYFPPTAAAAGAQFGCSAHLLFPSPPSNPCLLNFTAKPPRSNRQFLIPPARVQQSQPTLQLETAAEGGDVSNTRVVVQNVPWSCTVDDLRPLVEKYGTVVEIEFSMYNKTRNRGLAFVTMGSHEEALAVLNNLESSEFDGRILKLNWANPKKEKPSSPPKPKPLPVHNLFVANLPYQARAKDLREFFIANNGNAVSAEVIYRENPRGSAGYGFVSFNTKAEAEAALAVFQGKEFMGREIRVAQSKRFLRNETKAAIQSGSDKVT